MGVDIAARIDTFIGTFISRRNENCDDERRSPRTVSTRRFGKEDFKGLHRTVHSCLVRAARFLPAAGVASFTSIKQKLLILSGDVEMNPGPLEQRTQDPQECQCSEEHVYIIASLAFDLKPVAKRLIGKQHAKDIIDQEELSDQDKRDEVFEKWLTEKGPNATYKKLAAHFETLKYTENANAVRMLASNAQSDETGSILTLSKDPPETTLSTSMNFTKDTSFTIKNILNELKDVVEWELLGIQLDISASKLDEISKNCHGQVADCKREMIKHWHKSDKTCSWKNIIDALEKISQNVLAEETRKKYCPSDSLQKSLTISGNPKLALKCNMVQENCGCGKCDFLSLISNGCPTPHREPYKYLDTSTLTEYEKCILLSQLDENAAFIFHQLDSIVRIYNSWMEENVSLKEYKEILLTLHGIQSATKTVTMLNDRKEDIIAATDHMKCYAIVSDYCSWFNCSILETIVKSVTQKNSQEFLSHYQSYMDHLHIFCKRNIYECPVPADMSSTNGTTFLVLKVTEAHLSYVKKDISVEKIAAFIGGLMKLFKIEKHALKLHTVGEGCVELVYSIPICIYNELFPLNEDQCKSLPMLGVLELITKDYHYKKEHAFSVMIQQLRDIKDQKKQTELQLLDVQQQRKQSEQQLCDMMQQKEQTERELHDLKQLNEKTEQELRYTRKQNEQIEQQFLDVTHQQKQTKRQLCDMMQQKENTEQQLHDMKLLKETTDQQLHDIRQQMDKTEQQLHEVQEKKKQSEQRLHDIRQQMEKTEQQLHDMRQQMDKTEQQLHEVQEKKKQSEQRLHDIMQQKERTGKELHDLRQLNEKTEQELQDTIKQKDKTAIKLKQQLCEMTQQKEHTEQQLNKVKQQLKDQNCYAMGAYEQGYETTECTILKQKIKSLERELSKLKQQAATDIMVTTNFIKYSNDEEQPF